VWIYDFTGRSANEKKKMFGDPPRPSGPWDTVDEKGQKSITFRGAFSGEKKENSKAKTKKRRKDKLPDGWSQRNRPYFNIAANCRQRGSLRRRRGISCSVLDNPGECPTEA